MAAIQKPDGSVRPLHDATHSVMVNHAIRYQDKIECPGPAEIAAIVRESVETGEAPFCVSADIRAAHRLVKVRRADWVTCVAEQIHRQTQFGSTPQVRLDLQCTVLVVETCWAAGSFRGYIFQQRWMMHMIYVDDLHGVFTGEKKFLHLWIWLLAFEAAGTPFGYHKFKGASLLNLFGFQLRYDLTEVGISTKRGTWIMQWLRKQRATSMWSNPGTSLSSWGGLGSSPSS